MQTHEIPRNYKGEGRILYVFSTKGLIYTALGGMIGLGFFYIFNQFFKLAFLGIGFAIFFAVIGFVIGTFKIPENTSLKISKKVGGENIDEVIIRAIKFYKKKKRIYIYTKEENK